MKREMVFRALSVCACAFCVKSSYSGFMWFNSSSTPCWVNLIRTRSCVCLSDEVCILETPENDMKICCCSHDIVFVVQLEDSWEKRPVRNYGRQWMFKSLLMHWNEEREKKNHTLASRLMPDTLANSHTNTHTCCLHAFYCYWFDRGSKKKVHLTQI